MDNSCTELVTDLGIGWLFEKTIPTKSNVCRSALGNRDDGLVSVSVLESDGNTVIVIPSNDKCSISGKGSYTIGLFVKFPESSDSSSRRVLLDVPNVLKIIHEYGNIIFVVNVNGNSMVVGTEPSGINLCDGKTRLVLVSRNSYQNKSTLVLKVYGDINLKYEIDTDVHISPGYQHIVLMGEDVGNGFSYNIQKGTRVSGLFIYRGILTKDDELKYWNKGVPVSGTQLFCKLDEANGYTVFDSSGNGTNGTIQGNPIWVSDSNFHSWQNMFGYTVLGSIRKPVIMCNPDIDIENNKPTYSGRCRLHTAIQNIQSLKADGSIWGRSNPQNLNVRPGQDTFTVLLIVEKTGEQEGYVMCIGDRVTVRYFGGQLLISIGGNESTLQIQNGINAIELSVEQQRCEIYVNGVHDTYKQVSPYYTTGINFDILAKGGNEILNEGSIVYIALLEGLFSEEERSYWNKNGYTSKKTIIDYYMYSRTDVIFDLSGNLNHIGLFDVGEFSWSGKQSKCPRLLNGFTEIYPSRKDMLVPVVVPYDCNGKKIYHNEYGEHQVEVEYKGTGGILIFDAYINMNPDKLELGFWSTFWNKSNSNIWSTLSGQFRQDDPYMWNLQELTMDYLIRSMTEEHYNMVFSGSQEGAYGLTIELVDLVLLNLGNNMTYKPIPL